MLQLLIMHLIVISFKKIRRLFFGDNKDLFH